MTAAIENVAEPRTCASTERVRQHRERRRNGLRLMTVAMPEASIEQAISRGLLKPEDRAKPWAAIQACYGGHDCYGCLELDAGLLLIELACPAAKGSLGTSQALHTPANPHLYAK
jgi:hypothetical protein